MEFARAGGAIFVLVPQGDRGDWAFAPDAGEPLHRGRNAAESGRRRMRAIKTSEADGVAAEVRAVCGGSRRGDRERGTGNSAGIDEPRGGHLGTVTGTGGLGGRAVAGPGAGGGERIDRAGAAI